MVDVQWPLWVEYVKALGAPIVALIAAGIAGGIAYRQWKTASNKLKFDLFDKRVDIYEAALELIKGIVDIDPMKMDAVTDLAKRIAPAQWLLSKEIAEYLNELVKKAFGTIAKAPLAVDGLSDDERMALALRLSGEIMGKMQSEVSKLNELFSPYLEIEH